MAQRWSKPGHKAICNFVLAFMFLPPSTFLVGFYVCKKVQGWKKASGLQGWMSSSFRNIADHGSKLGTKTPSWSWCWKQERFGWALMEYVMKFDVSCWHCCFKRVLKWCCKRQSVTVSFSTWGVTVDPATVYAGIRDNTRCQFFQISYGWQLPTTSRFWLLFCVFTLVTSSSVSW